MRLFVYLTRLVNRAIYCRPSCGYVSRKNCRDRSDEKNFRQSSTSLYKGIDEFSPHHGEHRKIARSSPRRNPRPSRTHRRLPIRIPLPKQTTRLSYRRPAHNPRTRNIPRPTPLLLLPFSGWVAFFRESSMLQIDTYIRVRLACDRRIASMPLGQRHPPHGIRRKNIAS